MKRKRKYIPMIEKLAAALAMLLPAPTRDDLRARKVPAKAVIALFDEDHNILWAFEGGDKWWNLTPMLREEHREKTKRDVAIVAKVKRLQIKETSAPWPRGTELIAKDMGEGKLSYRVKKKGTGKRSWPKGRKIPSRPFKRTGGRLWPSSPSRNEQERAPFHAPFHIGED